VPRTLFFGLIGAALAIISSIAQANDRDLRATTIPASACQSTAVFSGFLSSQGNWVASGGSNSFVALVCPLPLNNIDLGGTTDDNDLSKFRVHYRDGDGVGTAAQVALNLYRITVTTTETFSRQFICSFFSAPSTTSYTRTTRSCAHDLVFGSFYVFNIEINAGQNTGDTEFVGIDFP